MTAMEAALPAVLEAASTASPGGGIPPRRPDRGGGPGVRLGALLDGIQAERSPGAEAIEIRDVTSDSRRVRAGSLFVAIRGEHFDGHDFLAAATAAGAAAVLVDRPVPTRPVPTPAVPWVRVADSRRAAGPLAAAFHRWPSETIRLAGITGTNGKTTVAWLLDGALRRVRGSSLLCGTVEHRIHAGDHTEVPPGAALTTREAADFQAFLARARAAGCAFGAVECSSHGLEQGRLGGTAFEAAVFTNLTRDHLDFHRDLDGYYEAKRRLFTEHLRPGGAAVVSVDDPFGARLLEELAAARPEAARRGFGYGPAAAVRIAAIRSGLGGTRVQLLTPEGPQEIASPLLGDFNGQNLAAAWAAATALGLSGAEAAAALSEAEGPPGRMERISASGATGSTGATAGPARADGLPTVLVDYAHTPDALARALSAARGLVGAGRLSVVFGCGGDRDRPKRALMGDAAARLADRVLVTSDNPRSEDPEAIIADIRQGADNPALNAGIGAEPDRRRAIEAAVAAAEPDELVLIAGRGHETHQASGGARLPLDDRALAAAALARRAGRAPAP